MNKFISHVDSISILFGDLEVEPSRIGKEQLINEFKGNNPDMVEDLDFCFEVLAGKHKLGFTYVYHNRVNITSRMTGVFGIKEFYNAVLKKLSATDSDIMFATYATPPACRRFMEALINRTFKLGYSNKHNMLTEYSPMLAKKYPDAITQEQMWYVQEKLDGNRCIARFDYATEEWEFTSRSGKPLKVKFDMMWVERLMKKLSLNDYPIFDGEIMTADHANSRDFSATSGVINSKYLNKSELVYYIYDIVDDTMIYERRRQLLEECDKIIRTDNTKCHILPILDKLTVYINPEYNYSLDEWLDKITGKGGEGIMLRNPNAKYDIGKRSSNLLKYKKLQTMDLRIIGYNEGKGKYEGAIGSFICQTDDKEIQVSVAGMPDSIRYSDPSQFIGRIIEVAYFDVSKSKNNNYSSLRFPRLKKFRDDKDATSIY